MISKKPICPRHPGVMGSHQTAGSVPAPRVNAPSHGSHVTALIAFLAVTGREYHCPHCWSSPCWELPSSHRVCFSLCAERKARTDRKAINLRSRCFLSQHIQAQFLNWLMLITMAMGMCLMNGYGVFKVQTHPPKSEQVKENNPFTCLLTYRPICNPWSKIFFQFFLGSCHRLHNGRMFTPFHFCDLLICIPTKVIQHQPAALDFRKFSYGLV